MIPLAVVMETVAMRTGLAEARMRKGEDEAGRNARAVFCYVARGLQSGSAREIGEWMGATEEDVEAACEWVGEQLSRARDFADFVAEVEIQARAHVGVASKLALPLPTTANPKAIALRLIESHREAGLVSLGDLASLGAAYLAMLRTRDRERSALQMAVETYERAADLAVGVRFTRAEAGALQMRDQARARIILLLGENHVEKV